MTLYEKIIFFLSLLAVPFLAFVISLLMTRYSIRSLVKWGFTAEMGQRHIHSKVMPTAGGIAMILAFAVCSVLFNCGVKIFRPNEVDYINFLFFIPGALLMLIGLYDDRIGMRASVKLFGQIAAGTLAWLFGIRFGVLFGFELPDYISFPLTVFWFLLYINAFNLIDGLDGLAAGLAAMASCTMACVLMIGHHWTEAVCALMLTAVCLGFLRYNFHPARLFMGDTGSMFLGYVLATLGLLTSNLDHSALSVLIPIMACGVPLIDTALAVWRRYTFKIISKRSWQEIMTADRAHLHHRILDSHHGNQSRTAMRIYKLAAVLSIVGLLICTAVDVVPALAVILLIFTMVLVLRKFAVVEIRNSSEIIFKGLAMPRRGVFVERLHPFYDLLVIAFSFIVSILLFENEIVEREVIYRTLLSALLLLSVFTICRVYKVYWLRAGTPDYLNLSYSIVLGFLVVLTVNVILNRYFGFQWHLLVLLPAGLISMIAILGERIHLRCLQLMLPRYLGSSEFAKNCIPVLLYGAGAQLSAYQTFASSYSGRNYRVVGILDSELALHGQYLYGYKILGDINDLEKFYTRYKFKKIIVITPNPLRSNYRMLKDFAAEKQLELTFFSMAENPEPAIIREDESC